MSCQSAIICRLLNREDFVSTLLNDFDRYQETNRVWHRENNQFTTKADHFIEQWNDDKKRQVIQSMEQCISSDGFVVGAFTSGKLIGFASVEGERFGEQQEYLELSYIHVSNGMRGCGIGKKMFELCRIHAKRSGAKKLYIAAHPSDETQKFYQAIGCKHAKEINERIYQKEPLDIQLECCL